MRAVPEPDAHPETDLRPWRRGLLQAVRDRLESDSYEVPPDAVAESIIERSLSRSASGDVR